MDKYSPLFLFHHPSFIFRNGKKDIVPFENDFASIYFSRIDHSLISLDKAPFGSFILKPGATKPDLISLVDKCKQWSQDHAISKIIIRSFPDSYVPEQSAVTNDVLLQSGFHIMHKDITQVIRLSDGLKLNTHKKRRIRKAESLGFIFRQVGVNFLEESYSLIVKSRKNKGYPVTMTMEKIADMFALFPNDYLLFGIFDKDKMIATSVSIKINPHILYCFYLGDDLAYRSYSPVTFLISKIHEFCRQHQMDILDLGISTDKGILNKGLYAFKKSFGTHDSYKLTFDKQL